MQEQGLSQGELNRPVLVFSTYSVHNITMCLVPMGYGLLTKGNIKLMMFCDVTKPRRL